MQLDGYLYLIRLFVVRLCIFRINSLSKSGFGHQQPKIDLSTRKEKTILASGLDQGSNVKKVVCLSVAEDAEVPGFH